MHLMYRYRLMPTKRQYAALESITEMQRQLYNAALQERISYYEKTGKSRQYEAQTAALTQVRKDDPEGYGSLPANLCRHTLKRLNSAYEKFFNNIEKGVGKPRFKSKERWSGFGFAEFSGIKRRRNKFIFKGMPGKLRAHFHRPLPLGKIVSCSFVKDHKGWLICLNVKVTEVAKSTTKTPVGIDLGIKCLAHFSDGTIIPAFTVAKRAEKEMRRRQRALSRCKKGSRRRKSVRRRVATLHAKIANSRYTYLHHISARTVKTYDLIAVENLRTANLIKNGNLSAAITNAGWSTFTHMLEYKAEKAGIHFVKVDPKLTTQECSGCGEIVRKGLSERVHNCPSCGLVLDRDHNAAINILHRAVLRPKTDNVTQRGERRARNIKAIS